MMTSKVRQTNPSCLDLYSGHFDVLEDWRAGASPDRQMCLPEVSSAVWLLPVGCRKTESKRKCGQDVIFTFNFDLDTEDIYRGTQINGSNFSRALCLDLKAMLVSLFRLTFL